MFAIRVASFVVASLALQAAAKSQAKASVPQISCSGDSGNWVFNLNGGDGRHGFQNFPLSIAADVVKGQDGNVSVFGTREARR